MEKSINHKLCRFHFHCKNCGDKFSLRLKKGTQVQYSGAEGSEYIRVSQENGDDSSRLKCAKCGTSNSIIKLVRAPRGRDALIAQQEKEIRALKKQINYQSERIMELEFKIYPRRKKENVSHEFLC